MTATTKNTPGLRNPATIAARYTAEPQAFGSAVKVGGTVLAVLAVATVLYVGYKAYENRFQAIGTNSSYPAATISDAQAQAKADAIFQAMVGFGANKEKVAAQITGLNYNDWVKVYNAFGKKQGAIPFSSEMDLVEWLHDQFNESELEYLRFFLNGVF